MELVEFSVIQKSKSVSDGCQYSFHNPKSLLSEIFERFTMFYIPRKSSYNLWFNQKMTMKNRLKSDFECIDLFKDFPIFLRTLCDPQVCIITSGGPQIHFFDFFKQFRTFLIPSSSLDDTYFSKRFIEKKI